MAEPIVFHAPPKHTTSSGTRLRNAREQHAEALLSSYELLQVLHDRGVLDLLRGLVGARDEVTSILTSAVNTPESIRGIRNFMLLTKLFAGIPPEVLQSLAATVSAGAEREESHKAPGMGHLLWRLRDKNSRHALAVILDVLEAVGKAL